MASRPKRLSVAAALTAAGLVALAAVAWLTPPGSSPSRASATLDDRAAAGGRTPTRIVSLVPALTEMLFAIGAGPQVVAVSSYDGFPLEVGELPRVGALLDPDVERILALRPDMVVTYGSQGPLEAQLERVGIRTFSYRHGGLQSVFETMRELGEATGHADGAATEAAAIQARLEAVRVRVEGRVRPRALLVIGRQPQSLQQVYVSGATGFLHEILDVAGGDNVFADVQRESVQPSQETLLARAPEVVLELRAARELSASDTERERAVWSALASVPAVRDGRIHFLSGDYLVIPGPRIGMAAEAFARALHPEAWE